MRLNVWIQIRQQHLNNSPRKILLHSAEVTAKTLQLLFNNAISNSEFPDNQKLADVIPVFKKKDRLDKTNYRPVSVWPPVSKMLERLMQKQINEHTKNKLSSYFCGYRKGFRTQYVLLSLIERCKKNLWYKRIWWSNFGGFIESIWYFQSWTISCKTYCFIKWLPTVQSWQIHS